MQSCIETASGKSKWPKHRLLRPLFSRLARRIPRKSRESRPGTRRLLAGGRFCWAARGPAQGEKTLDFKALAVFCQRVRRSQKGPRAIPLAIESLALQ